MKRLIFFVSALLVSVLALADPIEDLSMKKYKAGWYPNFYQGSGPMTCPKTCEKWVGAQAEHEASQDVDGQSERANVCKVTRDESIIKEPRNEPASHWIFGSQYDNYPVCFVNSLGYGPVETEYYMCECVVPEEVTGCEDPDLVVSQIHDPVWDHANGVSIVKVDVSNIGSSPAGAFVTQLTDTGTGATSIITAGGLAAGTTITLTFYFSYWVFDPNAELEAITDVYDNVTECKEDNNKRTYFKLG